MTGHGSPPPEDRANHPGRRVDPNAATHEEWSQQLRSVVPGRLPNYPLREGSHQAAHITALGASAERKGFLDKPRGRGKVGYIPGHGTWTRPPESIRERIEGVGERITHFFTGHY